MPDSANVLSHYLLAARSDKLLYICSGEKIVFEVEMPANITAVLALQIKSLKYPRFTLVTKKYSSHVKIVVCVALISGVQIVCIKLPTLTM